MGLFGGGNKLVIGLDVGSYSVKAVALQSSKGRLTLQGYSQARIGEDDVGDVISRVINQLGIKTRSLVTSVSGRSVIVRQVETPKLDGAELRSHMTYEADKYIPFSADEVVMDCFPLPPRLDGDKSNMDVILVAVRRGFVEDHVHMLAEHNAMPEIVDVDIFALTNAWWTLGPQTVGGPDEEAVALVDIGASKSWVAIVQGGRLLFQREIYLAGNEITDAIVRTFNESAEDVEDIKLNPGDMIEALLDAAMPAFEDLANEIRLSFDYVEGQFDQEVAKVILTGGSALMPLLPDMIGNILGRPAMVFDPLSGVDLITSKYDLHSLEANAPSLTVALGLACHLATNDDIRGLGGMSVAAWQPRRGRGQPRHTEGGTSMHAVAPAAAMEDDYDDDPADGGSMFPPPQLEPAPPLEMPGANIPAPFDSQAVPSPEAFMAPPPSPEPMMAPPAPESAGYSIPAAPDYGAPIAPAHDQQVPTDAISSPSGEVSSITDSFGAEASAMLVVLDDDDDDEDLGAPSVNDLPSERDEGGLPPLP